MIMNFTLYKRGLKETWKTLAIFAAILAMYFFVIIYMFDPEFGAALEQFTEAMPELMAMFGMIPAESTLLGFMSAYLYGFIMLAIPMVFSIICANSLMARHIDGGSMVYLLAAPVKRSAVALTQIKVIATGIIALTAFSAIIGIIIGEALFPGALEIGRFILLNAGVLSLHLFIAAICFTCSCIFNETKRGIWLGAGIPSLSFILKLAANNGGVAENAKYATFFTLFNPDKLTALDAFGIIGVVILFLGAIALFAAAIIIFSNKDLHI